MKKLILLLATLGSISAFALTDCKKIEDIKISSLSGYDSHLTAGTNLDAQLNGRYSVSHYDFGGIFNYVVNRFLHDDNKDLQIVIHSMPGVCKVEVEKLKSELEKLEFTDKKLESISTKIIFDPTSDYIEGFDVVIQLTQK